MVPFHKNEQNWQITALKSQQIIDGEYGSLATIFSVPTLSALSSGYRQTISPKKLGMPKRLWLGFGFFWKNFSAKCFRRVLISKMKYFWGHIFKICDVPAPLFAILIVFSSKVLVSTIVI